MPHRVTGFESTPNPDALKCLVDPPLPDTGVLRSYARGDEAAEDRLAAALLAVEGVKRVLIQPGFVTVSRDEGAAWGPIKKAVRGAIAHAP